MPTASRRLCAHTGCPDFAVRKGYCTAHLTGEYARIERYRGTSTARGYDSQWRKVREQALRRDGYVCVLCSQAGRVSLAQEVDHIIPLVQGGARLDLNNTQSLCAEHHAEKTARENARR